MGFQSYWLTTVLLLLRLRYVLGCGSVQSAYINEEIVQDSSEDNDCSHSGHNVAFDDTRDSAQE